MRCSTGCATLEVGEHLMEAHPTDLFIIVFRMIDSVMHRYWADMDPQHPLHEELKGQLIPDGVLQGYKLLDEAIGRLMAKAGSETTVYVISDHGFRAEDRTFAFNKWLKDRGMLKLRGRQAALISIATRVADALKIEMLLKKVAMRFLKKVVRGEDRYESWLYQTVDWPHSRWSLARPSA